MRSVEAEHRVEELAIKHAFDHRVVRPPSTRVRPADHGTEIGLALPGSSDADWLIGFSVDDNLEAISHLKVGARRLACIDDLRSRILRGGSDYGHGENNERLHTDPCSPFRRSRVIQAAQQPRTAASSHCLRVRVCDSARHSGPCTR
jgi:hypothetical protein